MRCAPRDWNACPCPDQRSSQVVAKEGTQCVVRCGKDKNTREHPDMGILRRGIVALSVLSGTALPALADGGPAGFDPAYRPAARGTYAACYRGETLGLGAADEAAYTALAA